MALMIRFFVQLGTGEPQRFVCFHVTNLKIVKNGSRTPSQNGIAFVNILIIAVTLIVVAVPEGMC